MTLGTQGALPRAALTLGACLGLWDLSPRSRPQTSAAIHNVLRSARQAVKKSWRALQFASAELRAVGALTGAGASWPGGVQVQPESAGPAKLLPSP